MFTARNKEHQVRRQQETRRTAAERHGRRHVRRAEARVHARERRRQHAAPAYREGLSERLNEAKIRISVSQHRFRVSIGVFNDMNDVDRPLEVLPKSPPG